MGFDDDDEARTLPALVLPLLRSGAAAAAAAAAGGGGAAAGGRIVVKPGLIIGVNINFFCLFFPPPRVCVPLVFLKQFFSLSRAKIFSQDAVFDALNFSFTYYYSTL